MGELRPIEPVLLLMAAFSRHDAALDWAQARMEQTFGPIVLASPRFAFEETAYYERSMGAALRKTFWAAKRLIDPQEFSAIKLQTNAWELEYASLANHDEQRPLNLDPGYITPAKLVLASTKDHAHRLYLSDGIYAEVTLFYKDRQWQARDWTFPDYRREDYQQFFSECRKYLRAQPTQRGE